MVLFGIFKKHHSKIWQILVNFSNFKALIVLTFIDVQIYCCTKYLLGECNYPHVDFLCLQSSTCVLRQSFLFQMNMITLKWPGPKTCISYVFRLSCFQELLVHCQWCYKPDFHRDAKFFGQTGMRFYILKLWVHFRHTPIT